MTQVLLQSTDDLAWLRKYHCKDLPQGIRSALMSCVNEDSPNKVEGWFSPNPDYDEKPDYVWSDEAGTYLCRYSIPSVFGQFQTQIEAKDIADAEERLLLVEPNAIDYWCEKTD